MKRFAMLLLTALIAIAALVTPAPKPVAAATIARYAGTMTTTVRLINVYGQNLGYYTFRTNTVVYISTQAQRNGIRESNPFNLVIQPNPTRNAYGEANVYSAWPFTFLAQYWRYNMTSNTQFSGRLVNNYAAYGIALNLLTIPTEIAPSIWHPFPHEMANGTSMSGSIDSQRATIRITGNTMSLAYPFSIVINATRF